MQKFTPLTCKDYTSISFDGCFYYITCGKTVIKYDLEFCQICEFCTEKCYTQLCYNNITNTFFAIANCRIYILDCCFNEIDCIPHFATSLSFNPCDGCLYFSDNNNLYKLNRCCEKVHIKCFKNKLIFTILICAPYYLVCYLKDNKYYIEIFDFCDNCINKFAFCKNFSPKQLFMLPSNISHIFCLCKKHGVYSYIAYLNEIKLDVCNCFVPCCDKHNHNCTDNIIESIALVESAIANILNAESEKIRKILCTTDDIDKIICVNKSVSDTIVHATHLEQVLYNKLSVAKELPDNKCKKNCIDCIKDLFK